MSERDEAYGLLLTKALQRIEALERELAAARDAEREPIAVIGLGCRFPGADDPDAYWRLLAEGRDAIVEVPADRWDVDAFYDPDPDAPGRMWSRRGGFVDRLAELDAELFGISPRETASLDPQQRLLLEVAWETFENAGLPPRSLPARTGVFVGISNVDYREAMAGRGVDQIDGYFSSGATASTASGRLSYFFGLTGPCLSLDTACSSSAVAVHLAVRSLRRGECDLALAGGVNRIVTPHESISLSKARMLAPDGRCKPFDAAANGYVRAEGCGLVVLQRAADARAGASRIFALVRGSATNQDGRRSGLTVPHGPSQQAVIREALRDAGIEPAEIGFVEAHGTGTALGDPIEAAALGAVFASRKQPLAVGSVKGNVGHLESAAGIAGLLKAILAIHHGQIPATLHLTRPSPYIDWDALPIRVPTALEPWPPGRRLAGVSSFGFSGTNCHVVVEEAPETAPAQPSERPLHVLALSAKSRRALGELARRYEDFLEHVQTTDLADICWTANTGRSHLEHRLCVVASTRDEMRERLAAWRAGSRVRGAVDGHAPSHRPAPRIAFLFTGQGSQHAGMGRALYETQPTFRRALDSCAEILAPRLDEPLLAVLFPEDAAGRLDRTAFAQPALFALEYSLAELWRSWGIEPDLVLGHSVGEYVAACVAGVFSLEDGLGLVAERGRLIEALAAGGAMVSVHAELPRVEAALAPYDRVAVAAINGPREIVVSGDGGQIAAVVAALTEQGIECRPLAVSHAFHSPLLEPVVEPFARAARAVRSTQARIPLISNLTGGILAPEAACDPEHWVRHLRAPVRFAEGLTCLLEQGVEVLLEIGPRPVLLGLGRSQAPGDDTAWLPSLRPGKEWFEMLNSLARLHVRGAAIDWAGFDRDAARRKLALPTYPFDRQRYWMPGAEVTAGRSGSTAELHRPEWRDWLVETSWRARERPSPSEDAAPIAEKGLWRIVAAAATGGDLLAAALEAPCANVLFVADRPSSADGPLQVEALSAALLRLTQTLTRPPFAAAPPRLWILTRGAQAVQAGEHLAVEQSVLWGLARTIAAEHPELRCISIDLDEIPVADRLTSLLAELTGELDEPCIAFRAGRRYVQRLAPFAPAQSPNRLQALRADASYLVTGGLGGLGLRVAARLAAEGAGHLVLAGRRGEPSDEAREAIAGMERAGATVRVMAADVSVETDVARLIAACSERGPLRGIVHAAGVLDDDVLDRQTPERFRAVLAPKVRGAWLLDRLTRETPLDFFLAFSSISAVLETLRSGAYAAANAFLDGLMCERRARGLPGLSVSWGPWAEVGMAARDAASFEAIGLRPIPPDQGARIAVALARLPSETHGGQIGVVPASWERFRATLATASSARLLDELTASQPASAPPVRAGEPLLRRALDASSDKLRLLATEVQAVLMEILGSREPLDPQAGFFELGMDSLMATELRERLQTLTGCPLPPTLAFKYPRLEVLLPFLAETLGLQVPDEGDAPGEPASLPSEEDLLARLAAKLRSHGMHE